jgi:hypothetical protein
MRLSVIKIVVLLAGICAVSPVYAAANYQYRFIFDYVGKSPLPDAAMDDQVGRDRHVCDAQVGVQLTAISARYRTCMMQRGWKYTHAVKELERSDRFGSCNDCDGPSSNDASSSSPPPPSGPSQDSIDSFNNSQQMLIQQYDNSFMPQPYISPN